MEGGLRMSTEQYRAEWLSHLQQRLHLQDLNIDLRTMPTLTELERACRRVQCGKATGRDEIPSEACHYHPAQMARHTYALLLKLLVHGQEAWRHKGGRLIHAFKGKGHADQCEAYRSLLISSHVGKTLRRAMRERQYHVFEQTLHPSQLGGSKFMPVSVGLHHARALLRCYKSRGMSVGLIFLDLQEAFYRIWRPLCAQCEYADDVISSLAAKLLLPDATLQQLRSRLCNPSILETNNMPKHYAHAVAAMHDNTWFQVPGQHDCIRTVAGSGPGDSVADVVFSYVFSEVLKTVHMQMDDANLLQQLPLNAPSGVYVVDEPSQTGSFLGPVWMDDFCICVADARADQLPHRAAKTLGILIDACRQFGMTPNLPKCKTEVLMSFQGPGSRAAKKKYFGPSESPCLPVVCEEQLHQIQIVGCYKHLGGIVHHSGSTKMETRRRLSIAHGAYDQHRRLLYRNNNLPMKTRKELFATLVLSKLCFGIESWTFETAVDKSHFHAGVMRLYRRFGGLRHDSHLGDDRILQACELPSPTILLRRARLR